MREGLDAHRLTYLSFRTSFFQFLFDRKCFGMIYRLSVLRIQSNLAIGKRTDENKSQNSSSTSPLAHFRQPFNIFYKGLNLVVQREVAFSCSKVG